MRGNAHAFFLDDSHWACRPIDSREAACLIANDRFAPKPAPGTKIVSVAALPEPQTAIRDLGGRRALSVFFWLISYGIRSRAGRAGVSYRYLFMHPSGGDLAQLVELIEQGKLKVTVDKTYPFANISDALAYVESGRAKGKVVVTNQ